MPMISTKTNIAITKEQELELKTKLGKAIEILSGKSESWLMLSFEDNCRLWFKGDNSRPTAYVEVKVYGKIDYSQSNKLTEKICEILKAVLGIDGTDVYVKYEEVEMWGWNGNDF
jgi:phenylpyruvate tautomerase PptA (4-oxalocrotonate tautomerase family)